VKKVEPEFGNPYHHYKVLQKKCPTTFIITQRYFAKYKYISFFFDEINIFPDYCIYLHGNNLVPIYPFKKSILLLSSYAATCDIMEFGWDLRENVQKIY
jgi:hypothetical protein